MDQLRKDRAKRNLRRNVLGWIVAAGILSWLPAGCIWRPLEHVAAAVESEPAATRVAVVHSEDRTLIEVHSPGGIGRSRVTFAETFQPGLMEFRLHLAGLERFELIYAGTRVALSVPQGGIGPQVTLQTADRQETLVVPGSPHWMEVEPPAPGDADPVFRVVAPSDLVSQQPKVLEFSWIDFYR